MLSNLEILETLDMINKDNLDVRTVTMGISLRDCCDSAYSVPIPPALALWLTP